MGLELVRQASKVLGPLLRRRGTSPALGAGLRKALGALDKSLGGLDIQKQEETIAVGIGELKTCLTLIATSDRPADHEQLEGIKKALAILEPEAASADGASVSAQAAPSLELSALAAESVVPSDPSVARIRQPRAVGAQAASSLEAQLAGLASRFELLHVTLSEPLFRLHDALAADAELRRQALVMKWLGRERVPDFLRHIDSATNGEERLVSGAALVFLGADRAVEWLLTILEHLAARQEPFPDISPTLVRSLGSPTFFEGALAAFRKPAAPAVCSLLLPLLAEQGLLPPATLWELANHPKDEVSIAASRALCFTAGSGDVSVLLGWAAKAKTLKRGNALLAAAAGLGSVQALDQIRTRLSGDAPIDFDLVLALAVAGGEADADLLLSLAARPDADADRLTLAAAHLGSPRTLEALSASSALSDSIFPEVLAECRRMIVGRSESAADLAALDPGVRYLRGKKWSVAEQIARLAAPDETLMSQQWLALDLRMRTGLSPPAAFPLFASSAARAELVSVWTAHFAAPQSRLRPGDWYYQGKPAARGTTS